MIYTETKGREEIDVMQASESAIGETNTISDNKAAFARNSTLSDELKEAKKKKALIADRSSSL